jgi:hypothetical protein
VDAISQVNDHTAILSVLLGLAEQTKPAKTVHALIGLSRPFMNGLEQSVDKEIRPYELIDIPPLTPLEILPWDVPVAQQDEQPDKPELPSSEPNFQSEKQVLWEQLTPQRAPLTWESLTKTEHSVRFMELKEEFWNTPFEKIYNR